jgi:hypothetical protein
MAAIRTVLVDKFSSCGNPFATLASTLTSVLVTPNNDNKLLVEVKQETPTLMPSMDKQYTWHTCLKNMRDLMMPRINFRQLLAG